MQSKVELWLFNEIYDVIEFAVTVMNMDLEGSGKLKSHTFYAISRAEKCEYEMIFLEKNSLTLS